MKKLALLCLAATLAGCSAAESTEEAPAKTKTPDEMLVGTYNVTKPDGSKMISAISKDHTYTDAVQGQVSEWGTWAIKDGKMCTTPATEDAKPACFTVSEPGADREVTITAEDGSVMKATKIS